MMEGRYREALDSLVPFCDEHPRHFASWYIRGYCHDQVGEIAESIACFSICISLRPDMANAYLSRAALRFMQGKVSGAEADLSRALKLRPQWTDALMNRAVARKRLKDYKGAIADLDRVLELQDAPTRAWFLRAEVRELAGDGDGARYDRTEGGKREPTDELSWSTRGYDRMSRDPAAALKDFDAALRLNPRSREALINKSIVLSEHLDRPREAVAVLDRFLQYYPDHVGARAGRGVVLARIGECERARADAEECLKRDQSAFILYQIAGLFAQIGKHERATESNGRAKKLLADALRSGFTDLALWASDSDLAPLRKDDEFKRLQSLLTELTAKQKN
jgi:tetratricopeptide (TPR) repeat protein